MCLKLSRSSKEGHICLELPVYQTPVIAGELKSQEPRTNSCIEFGRQALAINLQ